MRTVLLRSCLNRCQERVPDTARADASRMDTARAVTARADTAMKETHCTVGFFENLQILSGNPTYDSYK
ncbi:MAG: hypothetical protein DWP97_11730 [Calditrichaeota bacterium]|nr:MAG: hypothetical protein DWP97_11730 [Calditrichota bacterium]